MSVNILVDDDFTSFNFGSGINDFSYYKVGNFTANDGQILSGPDGTTIGSVPFTLTTTNLNNHVKFLALSAQPFKIPDYGELVMETTLSGKCLGVDCNPFPVSLVPNPQSDFRLACFGSVNLNYTYLITCDILLTNEVIYAIYEILPENKPSFGGKGPDYAAFSAEIPIGCKKDLDANGNVTVAVACSQTHTRYFINGEERYKTPRLGHYPDPKYITNNWGGPEVDRVVPNVNPGYATFSLLDYSNYGPCDQRSTLVALYTPSFYKNPCDISGHCNEPFFIYDTSAALNNRIWGQGAYMKLRKRIIYTISC